MIQSSLEYRFWYRIIVKQKPGDYPIIEDLSWSGLPFHTRMKFNWYFRYRAALLQVKYPKHEVIQHWGKEEPTEQQKADSLRNKIRAKKGKITEIQRKLAMARDKWAEIFPIEEDAYYLRAVEKLNRLKQELKEMEETVCQ